MKLKIRVDVLEVIVDAIRIKHIVGRLIIITK
jgi:hypothetical protein